MRKFCFVKFEAFAKLKPILRSPKIKLNFKIRLFKAACISILLYGSETWILKPVPTYWPSTTPRDDPRAPTEVHRSLYPHAERRTRQPICHLWIKDQIISSTRSTKDDISQSNFVAHIQSGDKSLVAGEIRKMAVNKYEWNQLFVVSKKKKYRDRSSKLLRWWWWFEKIDWSINK